jgi:hypothetical protein
MRKVDDYERIRKAYHIEGLSIREISRRYKHSRRLVRKALEHPIPEKYHLWQAKKAKVLRQYLQRILDLEENRPPPGVHVYCAGLTGKPDIGFQKKPIVDKGFYKSSFLINRTCGGGLCPPYAPQKNRNQKPGFSLSWGSRTPKTEVVGTSAGIDAGGVAVSGAQEVNVTEPTAPAPHLELAGRWTQWIAGRRNAVVRI